MDEEISRIDDRLSVFGEPFPCFDEIGNLVRWEPHRFSAVHFQRRELTHSFRLCRCARLEPLAPLAEWTKIEHPRRSLAVLIWSNFQIWSLHGDDRFIAKSMPKSREKVNKESMRTSGKSALVYVND